MYCGKGSARGTICSMDLTRFARLLGHGRRAPPITLAANPLTIRRASFRCRLTALDCSIITAAAAKRRSMMPSQSGTENECAAKVPRPSLPPIITVERDDGESEASQWDAVEVER